MNYNLAGTETAIDKNNQKVQVFPIDKFIAILSNEFNFVKSGNLDYRLLIDRFTRMYGSNALMAVEHFYSFINMLECSNLKVGLFNDMMIDNVSSVYVDDINKIILSI
jgi:hypothetical protein